MSTGCLGSQAVRPLRGLVACVITWIAVLSARADLVNMHVSYSGGSPTSFLYVALGTEWALVSGPSGEGSQSISLHPDEAMLLHVYGSGIGDYRITFTPAPQYGTLIDGTRRAAYIDASAVPRSVNHQLPVTMIRRERSAAASMALGQASTIAWHPPKMLGAMGPYIDFNLGQALNGEALPPLRIPLFPRGSLDAPLPLDPPDTLYEAANGGFTLVAPQVVAHLTLDPQNPGYFWLKFHAPSSSTPFASYHFQFPVWPPHWSASRQARVLKVGSVSGSAHNYETSLAGFFHWSGMVQTAPTNTWTLSDWRVEGHAPLRTLLGKREAVSGGSGDFGEWFVSGTVTDTTEIRTIAQDPNLSAKRIRSYQVFDRWLTDDPLEGIQTLIAPYEMIEGPGDGHYVTKFFQDPRAQSVTGSEAPGQFRIFADVSSTGKKEYETWLNNSPGFNPTAGSGSQVAPNGSSLTTVTYEPSPDLAAFQLPKSIVRQVGSVTFARSEITYTSANQIITATRSDYASSDDHTTSVMQWYRPDASEAALRSRPRSVEHAGGGKQSFAYVVGPTELRVITLSGARSGGNVVDGLPEAGSVDPIHLLPNRSTKMVETFKHGHLTKREIWIYLGGAGAAPVFNSGDAVVWEAFDYTADGRVAKRTASNHTEYTAAWLGDRKIHELDETGLKTTFHYDVMDRLIALEREAAGGLPAQAQSFEYDSASRMRYLRVGPIDAAGQPSGEQLATEFRYDLGGRLRYRVDPGGMADGASAPHGIATAYTYPNGGRDVVETLVDGNRSLARFTDGRTQSIGGTAVVTPESYTYQLDSTGQRVTTILFAGQRPRTITTDWLGRTAEVRVNGPVPASGPARPIATSHHYDSRGLLVATNVAESAGSSSLAISAERVFEYDEFGALRASGLNLDGVPGLQESSPDRLSVTDTKFYLDANNAWWLQATTKLYHTNGSAGYHSSHRFTRLTQFAGGTTSQVDHLDFHNNRSSEIATYNPAQKTRSVTVRAADSTRRVSTTIGGLTLTEQVFNDAGSPLPPTTFVYDPQGRLRQTTSPRGIVSRHEYHPGTTQRRQTFEGRNEIGHEIPVATFAYDAAGRVAAVADAHGRSVTHTYYPTGLLRDRGGVGAHPVHYEYNAHGQLKELWTYRNGTGGVPDKTLWTYDSNTGWLSGKTDAAGRNVGYTYAFNSPYRLVTRMSPRGGLTTTYKYQLDTGELAAVDYSDATPDLAYTYTRTGQMDTVSDVTGIRDYLYDRERLSAEHLGSWHGGLVLTALPDDTTVQNPSANRVPGRYAGFALGYVPVVNGVPQTQDMAREMKVALSYDDFGRTNAVAVSHGGQASAAFTYDFTPNSSFWRSRSSGSFRQERTPETGRNLLKRSTSFWNATLLSEHVLTTNDAGELSSAVQTGALFSDYGGDGGTTSFAYGYNDRSELTSATGYLGAPNEQILPGRSYAFDYDTAGNRRFVGVDSFLSSYFGEPNTPGANALNQIRQRRILPGRTTGTAHAAASVTVAGASIGRVSGTRYWDAVLAEWGRFTEVNVTSSRNGQSQSAAVWSLVRPEWESLDYDEEGNLVADAQWRYQYDAENRLIRMTTRPAAELPALGWMTSPPSRELTFKYDHAGRRVEKTSWKNGVVTFNRRFVYAGWNLIAEFELVNGVPNVRRSYAWGLDTASSLDATGGIGALVLQTVHQGATRTHYHVATDGHGSVTALLDQNGSAAAVYEYDPFGQPLRAEGATATEALASADQPGDNPFRYSNKYWDRETGLYDYGLRFYDPSLGRFINRDPIGEAGGTNLYAFVGNSPVNRWDYLGLDDYARPFGPEIEFWGPTPESAGEDGSYRNRARVDIRDNADYSQNWGTDSANDIARYGEITATPDRVGTPLPLTLKNVSAVVVDAVAKAVVGAATIGNHVDPIRGNLREIGTGFAITRTAVGKAIGVDVNNPRFNVASDLAIVAISIAGMPRGGQANLPGQTVTVFRVEGVPNARIVIDGIGRVVVTDGKTLWINIGQGSRAWQYLQNKIAGGLPGAQIKSFEVSRTFLDQIRALAVREADAHHFPGRPIIGDPTKAPDQFGLRPEQIETLKRAIIQGTGTVLDR